MMYFVTTSLLDYKVNSMFTLFHDAIISSWPTTLELSTLQHSYCVARVVVIEALNHFVVFSSSLCDFSDKYFNGMA